MNVYIFAIWFGNVDSGAASTYFLSILRFIFAKIFDLFMRTFFQLFRIFANFTAFLSHSALSALHF